MRGYSRSRLSRRLALVSSAALFFPGCRIGNNVEAGPQLAGLYETSPAGVKFCAFFRASAGEDYTHVCGDVPASEAGSSVPAEIRAVFTDPVGLKPAAGADYNAALYNPADTRQALPVAVSPSDKKLGYSKVYNPSTFWLDDACQSQVAFSEAGSYAWYDTKRRVGKNEVSGRIELKVEKYTVLGDGCSPTLQLLQNCYADPDSCASAKTDAAEQAAENQARYDLIHSYFAPFMEVGAMTEADIPQLLGLYYEVLYK